MKPPTRERRQSRDEPQRRKARRRRERQHLALRPGADFCDRRAQLPEHRLAGRLQPQPRLGVTIDEDTWDLMLTRGQSFVVDRNGAVLACAIQGSAVVDVLPPARVVPVPARARGVARPAWLRGAWRSA
jgi:hypothetical protein